MTGLDREMFQLYLRAKAKKCCSNAIGCCGEYGVEGRYPEPTFSFGESDWPVRAFTHTELDISDGGTLSNSGGKLAS